VVMKRHMLETLLQELYRRCRAFWRLQDCSCGYKATCDRDTFAGTVETLQGFWRRQGCNCGYKATYARDTSAGTLQTLQGVLATAGL
jgi:glycyl-tRNA synthetase alpha subunit